MPSQHRLFFREFVQNFHTTGAVLPSSRFLGSALTRYVAAHPSDRRPRAILEVGPGTGAVTSCLVNRLAPDDRLTLVELNESFVTHLRGRFASEPSFARVADKTQIIHDRLENLDAAHPFDVIVSGLPLNNFSVSDVEQILSTLGRLLAVGGTLSFFEYIAVRTARCYVGSRKQRQRLRGISRALESLFAERRIRRQWVWANFPPAWVHHVRG
ncbi:MAG TPA: methyltransferase domain-containing protein [Pirellulales bacterium]|nr:methyltransferase domain-containing protein [Pirellulales bacterium]